MNRDQLISVIDARLKELGTTAAEASRLAVGNPYLISNLKRGRATMPNARNLGALCEVLQLDFSVGRPSGKLGNLSNHPPTVRFSSPKSVDLESLASEWTATKAHTEAVLDTLRRLAEGDPQYPIGRSASPAARPVPAMKLAAAAGAGAADLDHADTDIFLWFRRSWLDRMGLDSTQCVVIDVRGESMEPTLPEGCSVLVNRSAQRRLVGKIFVLDAEDGLVVKRAGKDSKQRWLLESDHPEWKSVLWPQDAELIGQVRWMARAF